MFFGFLQHFFMFSHVGGGSSFLQPLSAEEETLYVEKYENGSDSEKKAAKDVLIERNLRLVAHIVKKYSFKDNDDLISVGTIGLIKGISSYNSKKGTRLATYASRCIENATPTQRLNWTNMTLKVCLLARNGIYSATSIAIG